MKRMAAIAAVLLCCLLWTLPVHGEQTYTYDETLAALLGASGAPELETGLLPEDADLSDPDTLTSLSLQDVTGQIGAMLSDRLHAPLRVLAMLTGVILLSALAGSLKGEGSAAGPVYEIVCTLCAVGIAAEPVSSVFAQASAVLTQTADFMVGFSAVFGGILAVSGGMTASAVYQSGMVFLCELALEIATKVLLPLLSMSLAMSIVDAVNPTVSLGGIIHLTQKAAAWLLGLLMAVFLGLLSVQSMVAVSADRAGSKAAKYMISGAVPIVGGAVSEAYAAVISSMGILRSGVGMVGILSLLTLLLPVLLELGIYRLVTAAAAAVSELFGVTLLTRLFKNMECVLATGFSVAVCFSVMFIFSTAVLMLIGVGLTAG